MKKFLTTLISFMLFAFLFNANAGRIVPDFFLKSEFDYYVKRDALKGKPSVLIFWGINCHTCKHELPQMNKLYKKYKKKVNFFAIVVDSDDIKEIKETKKMWGFDIPVLIGDRKTIYRFRVIGVPMILILDKNLNIYRKYFGAQSNDKIEGILKTLLQEK